MHDRTFAKNMELMGELWPKFRMDPALRDIVYERWQHLHQDKLYDCIRQHRMEREIKPDIAAIHRAYCAITGDQQGEREVQRTMRAADRIVGPTPQELEDWDRWAAELLAGATEREIADARERIGVMSLKNPRILAVAVEYCRMHG